MRRSFVVFLLACPIAAQDPLEARILALGDPEQSRKAQLELLRGDEGFAELGDLVLYGHRRLDTEANARAVSAGVAILQHAGIKALPAMPALLGCIEDPYLRPEIASAAADALCMIAPHASPKDRKQLMTDLGSRHGASGRSLRSDLKHQADYFVRRINFDGNAAWDKLARELDSADPVEVGAVTDALARRSDELEGHREEIANALIRLYEKGVETRVWKPALSSTGTRTLRTQLASALCQFAPRHQHTWLGWCQRLLELDPAKRIEAARALGRIRHPDALPWLLDVARRNHTEPDVAVAALDAIRGFGPTAAWLVPDLRFSHHRLPKAAQPVCLELIQILGGGREWTQHEGPPVQVVGVGLEEDDPRLPRTTATLTRWLEADNGIHRERLLRDPLHATMIPRGDDDMRWLPFLRYPDKGNSEYWAKTFLDSLPGAVLITDARAIDERGRRSHRYGRLLYLVPMPDDRATIDADVRYQKRGPQVQVPPPVRAEYRALLDDMAELGLADAITIDGVIYAGWRTTAGNQYRTGVSARWRDRVPDMRILQRVWDLGQTQKRR